MVDHTTALKFTPHTTIADLARAMGHAIRESGNLGTFVFQGEVDLLGNATMVDTTQIERLSAMLTVIPVSSLWAGIGLYGHNVETHDKLLAVIQSRLPTWSLSVQEVHPPP